MSLDDARLLQRNAQIPVWRQIETDLTVEIRSGLIAPGEKLPSEHEFSQRYGVNRHTVRVALARLARNGLVVAVQGKGVFVSGTGPVEYRLNKDAKWSEVEKQFAASPGGRLIAVSECPATRRIAEHLRIDEGAPLLVTETLRVASAGIATYSYHFFEKARFAGLDTAFERLSSFTEALAEYGVTDFTRASTWIDCRIPRPREADALDIPVETPVLVMMYVDQDRDGRPIFFSHSVIPTTRMVLRVDTA
ncbi:MAG: phosphonate metabolism transcriptional regulator PhnF [Hyphomicrobiaceae bacterium]|nr:phosphonate metabolism transcriptional regulator PhnF [Hyphomicrobiaceae bacterium]